MKNLNSFPPVVQGRSNAGDARAWPIHKEGVDDLILITLQEINISHLGKRKIIFKYALSGDMLIPWRVSLNIFDAFLVRSQMPCCCLLAGPS